MRERVCEALITGTSNDISIGLAVVESVGLSVTVNAAVISDIRCLLQCKF